MSSIPPHISLLPDMQLRDKLPALRFHPGPITATTRKVYERKLLDLLSQNEELCGSGHSGYSEEMELDEDDGPKP